MELQASPNSTCYLSLVERLELRGELPDDTSGPSNESEAVCLYALGQEPS